MKTVWIEKDKKNNYYNLMIDTTPTTWEGVVCLLTGSLEECQKIKKALMETGQFEDNKEWEEL